MIAPYGDGKSHLLQACIDEKRPYIYIPSKKIYQHHPHDLNHVEGKTLFIDDIDHLAQNPIWEQALFRSLTICPQQKIIASTSKPIQNTAFHIPDLASRLQALCPLFLAPLSEEGQRHALQQRAKKRGLIISTATLCWLQKRLPRDNHTMFNLLSKIDHLSLSQQTKPSIGLLKKILIEESYLSFDADLPD